VHNMCRIDVMSKAIAQSVHDPEMLFPFFFFPAGRSSFPVADDK
jgi:hypothetical protein